MTRVEKKQQDYIRHLVVTGSDYHEFGCDCKNCQIAEKLYQRWQLEIEGNPCERARN